ncbi:MAG: diaminopimelate epimerase [Balneolaceae bacterium]
MATISFTKMEGAGNDFIVIDNRAGLFTLAEIIEFTPKLCHRKFGIGADGILVLDNAQLPEVDYTMTYRNADGSDAGMCGNGSRCLALYAFVKGFNAKQLFNVHDKIYSALVNEAESTVKVSFPAVKAPKSLSILAQNYTQVYTGTEHLVQFVEKDILENEKLLFERGHSLRWHPELNPPGTNVNFVWATSDSHIHLETYERGVENLTLACGTGAIASAIATHHNKNLAGGWFDFQISVKGGDLKVSFEYDASSSEYNNVSLGGPAHFVFEGTIDV